jgi:hypothetical protein
MKFYLVDHAGQQQVRHFMNRLRIVVSVGYTVCEKDIIKPNNGEIFGDLHALIIHRPKCPSAIITLQANTAVGGAGAPTTLS